MFVFFNDAAPTEIYTLALHDALPISTAEDAALEDVLGLDRDQLVALERAVGLEQAARLAQPRPVDGVADDAGLRRPEEHTSELQSSQYLVCRLSLEKKNSQHTVCPSR